MCQQLRFHPMDSRRLLQGFDHMRQQPDFYLTRIRQAAPVCYKQIADHSLAALVNEKRVPKDTAAVNRGIARKDLGVDVAQNHLRRAGVVPRQKLCPQPGFIVEQGPKVDGGKVPEVENLQTGLQRRPAAQAAEWTPRPESSRRAAPAGSGIRKNPSVVGPA